MCAAEALDILWYRLIRDKRLQLSERAVGVQGAAAEFGMVYEQILLAAFFHNGFLDEIFLGRRVGHTVFEGDAGRKTYLYTGVLKTGAGYEIRFQTGSFLCGGTTAECAASVMRRAGGGDEGCKAGGL